ncbi:cell division protein : ATP-dependent zinc metalloprotease FtsH OS=planctomycete KSU-1 GN=ftsH PE=3 SV=1: AAA: Peptidase_M41 [Tuwongella immobilis]|uniref:ATP-dependent zinc metalloprotease FtsH n=1 Tax=Tuwongella immobilis TaxID=692036 RepID=A0A6C2YSM6_9BACT|nr:ATP-dependent zinc metalloprotease FtsH [Tuwongella immobilis]VIP04381.1 cell division protein : ATP-dependent zinc metalloprotease FtsH OS=planctomycete KSU-1 GN=ftsH PE=3 SV=1: AAA: Peptidase_M41 [Tuwongella immobilis]VTS06124.1 cell division protein : ATP-dependent zinc metalloprotease FtsH OS=planctomycete KSU-1 GN=ftsH PE=3 SV=1: AAA: Peptidase_M41 [Tuwongella immobilis]
MAESQPDRNKRVRTASPSLLIVLFLLGLVYWMANRESLLQTVRYGQFRQMLGLPGVEFHNLHIGPNEIRGEIVTRDRISGYDLKDAQSTEFQTDPGILNRKVPFRVVRTGLERDDELVTLLQQKVGPNFQADDEETWLRSLFTMLSILVTVLLISALLFFLRQSLSGGGAGAFGVGRSRHKIYTQDDKHTTFADVAGIDEAKAEMTEIVDFLKRPDKYQALGGRIPKGVLLVGPPGTGKTLLAKAVAGEAGVPFFSLSGSDFVELFVGVGASRVRDLFRDAEQKAPCIIFIDELDAMGKSRSGNAMGSHEEREQTLNQLLVEMDGFETNRGVILMAATNRPETLDPALLRPGRFDRTIVVDRPDIEGRIAILKVHARNVKLGDDVNLRRIAALTPGSVGADLANLVNEATLLAARRGQDKVHMSDFDEAIERSAVGLQRKSRIMRPDEKRRVAIHEAGHALVACATPRTDPVHKVSIIPRGVGVGGYVLQRPENDRLVQTQTELEGIISVLLGGTLAEEAVFPEISTGASNDLMRANQIAKRMVTEFGMSRLGRIYFREGESPLAFLGGGEGGIGASGETAREIEMETRRIIENCLNRVRELLVNHRETLDAVANQLVEVEVMDGRELLKLLDAQQFPLTAEARRGLEEPPPSLSGMIPLPPVSDSPTIDNSVVESGRNGHANGSTNHHTNGHESPHSTEPPSNPSKPDASAP